MTLALHVFWITAIIVITCAMIAVGFYAFVYLVVMPAADPSFDPAKLYSELASMFTTAEGVCLFFQVFGFAALASLYVSIPLSFIVSIVYCFVKWIIS